MQLLKALREKNLVMNFSRCLRFLVETWINLETQKKTLIHIIDENKFE